MLNRKQKKGWGILIFLAFTAAITGLTMLLWNLLIPVIFGGIMINYWQALGLLILGRILFGGFGFQHFAHHLHSRHHADFEQLHNLSKDERRDLIRRHMEEHGFCKNRKRETSEDKQAEQ